MKHFILYFVCLLVSFSSYSQVPSVGQKAGSKSSIEGVKGWYEPDSGFIVPGFNAKKSAAGIAFNKPGRFWYTKTGDSSFYGWDGVREFKFYSAKDSNEIKAFAAAGSVGPQGPPGADGNDGADGVNGIDGKTWYSGTGVPSSGTGVDGDFYFRTATGDVYLKTTGAWGIIANITGPTGATGATGPAGADGSNGTNGTNGVDGSTWYSGAGAPSGGTGVNGDYYFNTANSDVYKKTAGSWSVIANIQGATGATGAAGANGANGTNGTNGTNGFTWYSGSGVPSGGTGVDGDYYFRTATGDVYGKAAGSWSIIANITGPTGATGATGSAGATGATGPAGPNNITTATTTNITGILGGDGANVKTAVAGDFPTLNQNTTGSAATLTTPRDINGIAFNGSANITVTAAAGTLTGTALASNVVTTSITGVSAITAGTWTASVIGLQYGGTGANLTASNGGIVYSNSSTLAILAGTATANKVLQSGSSTTPAWSTATYPATASTAGNVMSSDGTNFISHAPIQGTTVGTVATTYTIASTDIRPIGITITAQTSAIHFAAPTGTFGDMQVMILAIKDNGTARALTWNAAFVPGTTSGLDVLPATTTISKWIYIQYLYNLTATKWYLQGITNGFP